MRSISRKIGTILLIVSFALSALTGIGHEGAEGAGGTFGGGDGTRGNPYVIEDVKDLQNMSSDLSAHYVLKNDINASATSSWNSGAGFVPVGNYTKRFTGSLDGKNHTITGLFINRSLKDYNGLFGFVDTTYSVKNVGLVDNNVTGFQYVGALVGCIEKGMVINSFATGNVTGKSTYLGGLVGYNKKGILNLSYATGNVNGSEEYVGGLVGYNDNGTINHSYASGSVRGAKKYVGGLVGCNDIGTVNYSYATGDVNGSAAYVGGLAGWNGNVISYCNGTVNNSYATGNVVGNNRVGGLVGFTKAGTVTNSYSTGNIIRLPSTDNKNGGFMGTMVGGSVTHCYSTGKVTYNGVADPTDKGFAGWTNNIAVDVMKENFWDKDTSLQATTSGTATGESTMNMMKKATFTNAGWDFNNVWCIDEGTSYPKLRWQQGGILKAKPGPVQVVDKGTLVKFNGSASTHYDGIVNYTWNFTDGTPVSLYGAKPSYRFNTYGNYSVTLRVTDIRRNWDTATMKVVVKDLVRPVADAGPHQRVDEDTLVTFDGSGSSDNLKVVNWTWTFTDGTPRTLYGVKPTYQFDRPRRVAVQLNVTDEAGNWQVDTMTVTVLDITSPVADAGPDQVVDAGATVIFDGSGSKDNAGITKYTWTFNDGTGDIELTGDGPSHTFNVPGLYNVVLNIRDAAGHEDTDALNVTVNDTSPPVSAAGPDQTIDEGALVTLNGSGSTDNVGIINHTWTFNDGSDDITLHGVAPSHTFNVPGVYMVTLNVTDGAGSWDSDVMNVTVRDITSPVSHAGPDQTVDEDTEVTFDGTASSDNVGITNHTWTCNDGSDDVTLHGVAPSHTFSVPGVYTVTLTVTDGVGSWSMDVMTVTVRDITSPVPDAGPDLTVDEVTEVTFDGAASSDNVGITDCTWTFNDGTGEITLQGIAPSHIFTVPGVYTVTLTATDAVGLSSADTMTVTVRDITSPSADAGPDQTVDEDAFVTLDGRGSGDNVGIVNWTWTFTDGTSFTFHDIQLTHQFNTPGVFVVTMELKDAAGNAATDTLTVTVTNVNDLPVILSEVPPSVEVLEKGSFTLDLAGTDEDGDDLTWSDDTDLFDIDPDTGSISFVAVQDDVGSHDITITVDDGHGGTDVMIFELEVIEVNDPPELLNEMAPQVDVNEDEVIWLFMAARDEEDEELTWSSDSDRFPISPTNGSIKLDPTQDDVGEWWFNVTVEDSGGLTADVSFSVVVRNVNDVPVISSIGPVNDSRFKQGEVVTFTVTVDDVDGDELTITWSSEGETLGTGSTLEFKKLKPGTRVVKVSVSDGTETTEEEITLVIKKKEEGPGFGSVVVFLALLVIVVLTRTRRIEK